MQSTMKHQSQTSSAIPTTKFIKQSATSTQINGSQAKHDLIRPNQTPVLAMQSSRILQSCLLQKTAKIPLKGVHQQ